QDAIGQDDHLARRAEWVFDHAAPALHSMHELDRGHSLSSTNPPLVRVPAIIPHSAVQVPPIPSSNCRRATHIRWVARFTRPRMQSIASSATTETTCPNSTGP